MNVRTTLGLLLHGVLLAIGVSAIHAAVFNIPNGDVVALKNAIIISNSNGEAGTVATRLLPPGATRRINALAAGNCPF